MHQSKKIISEVITIYLINKKIVLLFSIPYSLFPIPYSLFPIPYSLFPIPCSLFPTFTDKG
ncbi:hypothetical protein [Moorena producens]|uniref:hypothetical protein n=1 Tax=Moorena producens TaxID=1155739 RepID=UPI0009F17A87|nr:hypothetical protein [Moorena producens]